MEKSKLEQLFDEIEQKRLSDVYWWHRYSTQMSIFKTSYSTIISQLIPVDTILIPKDAKPSKYDVIPETKRIKYRK